MAGGAAEGAVAERALAVLPKHAWTVFHDLHWPEGAYDDVRHVVVGPGGVFVVGRDDRAQVVGAARELASMASTVVSERHVHPVLCREDLRQAEDDGVRLTTPSALAGLMTGAPVVLTPQQITHLCLTLDWTVLRRD